MNQETFSIPNISCGHCTRTIENELSALAAVSAVSADSESKRVVVTTSGEAAEVEALLEEIGFPGKAID